MSSIEIELQCAKCGHGLDGESKITRFGTAVVVEPCSVCVQDAYDRGVDDEHKSGA